jgi:hypothetical protein
MSAFDDVVSKSAIGDTFVEAQKSQEKRGQGGQFSKPMGHRIDNGALSGAPIVQAR